MDDVTATLRSLTIGNGTVYKFLKWPTNLIGGAPVRVDNAPRPMGHGAIAGRDYVDPKMLTFEVQVRGTTRADLETKLVALESAFASAQADQALDVRMSGTPAEYRYYGRPRGTVVAMGRGEMFQHQCAVLCSFEATDPVRYGASVSEQTGLVAHTIPATLPFVLGLYGDDTITVAGNVSVERWTVTFTAPSGGALINPRIQHVGTGEVLAVEAVVPASNQLVLDGYTGTAILGIIDQTLISTSVSQWFELAPGANSLRFSADGTSHTSSTSTIAWRPGWL